MAARELLTNWNGSPCPACGAPLRYRADLPGADTSLVLVLLRCEFGHCWQERLRLDTLYSDLFVERRGDLER